VTKILVLFYVVFAQKGGNLFKMEFISTRDITQKRYSATQVIKNGLSHDGGLFVPEKFPKISNLANLVGMSYSERASLIFSKFLTECTQDEIDEITNKAYNKDNFATDSIAPVYNLNDTAYFLELWHGPTCAFKDVALQALPHLMSLSNKKLKDVRQTVILAATSGDTGKAALEGFKDVDGVKIIVFYPKSGVSDIQRLQMTTQKGNNVMVAAVEGNFDDAQTGVKNIFNDKDFRRDLSRDGYTFSSANSINWGRLMPQIVYYFSAYCDMVAADEIALGETLNAVVPTGNFGNILAAYYAKNMGLPLGKLICASNANNVLADFIQTGVYNANRDFHVTASPSMDILISSNLERLLYLLSGNNANMINDLMTKLKNDGEYTIPDTCFAMLKRDFYGAWCDDNLTAATIKDVWDNFHYIMDPHTAVAKNVHDQYINETGDKTKTLIASTASPYKFADFVCKAISNQTADDEFEYISLLNDITRLAVPKSLAELKDYQVRFDAICKKTNMSDFVRMMV
jgi:threonine synthase